MASITTPYADHARLRGEALALVCDGDRLTWRELRDRVDGIAGAVAAETPGGASVALDLADPLDMALAFLGCVRAGREALVFEAEWSAATRARVLAALTPGLTIGAGSPLLSASVSDAALPDPEGDAPLLVGFTSGSTGSPKGFRRCQKTWTTSFDLAQREFALRPEDVVFAPGRLSFSLFLFALAHGLYVGASVHLTRRFRPRPLLAAMAEEGATVLYAVPTQAKMLLEAADRSDAAPLASLRLILTSGAKWHAALSERVARHFPHAEACEFYGASELSFVTVARRAESPPPLSVGRAFAGVNLAVRDDAGADRRAGAVGRIWVRSPMVFEDYALGSAPECRWERRDDGDWYTVGDHGHLDAMGFLHLAGREKRMLVTSGANLYPEAVEEVLRAQTGVAEAAVLGLADALRGQRIVAVICPEDPDRLPDPTKLARACQAALGSHAAPKRFYRLDNWPLTRTGKTDFAAIEAMFGDGNMPDAL